MVDVPDDRLAQYYAEKLWELIPPVYRHEDGTANPPGVLRAFVEVLADQAAVVRRSNDRLWDDQFVEFCDDWAVPYIGDLVGTRMVSALDLRARRVDVAKTIYYRRRAGTLAVLEQLIADTTGWEGTVVEEFRRLLRHPHGLDPRPAATGSLTATPAHGLPDLRSPRGRALVDGPWDEYHHLPDMRHHRGGRTGRLGVSRLAFHLYRLASYRIERADPHELAALGGDVRFTFDPSGRAVPLFQRRIRGEYAHAWRSALAWEMPAPIRCEVLAHAEYELSDALILRWSTPPVSLITASQADVLRSLRDRRFVDEARLRARIADLLPALSAVALRRILADSLVPGCGKAVLLTADPPALAVEVPVAGVLTAVPHARILAGNLSARTLDPPDRDLVVDAENGLGYFTAGAPPAGALVSYHLGFSGDIGAGTHDRDGLATVPPAGQRSGGGAVAAPPPDRQVALEIVDNRTYTSIPDLPAQERLVVQAGDGRRPYLELAGDWTITATEDHGTLVLDGLWIGGRGPRELRLAAAPGKGWATVTLRHMTLDPGGKDADDQPLGPIVLSVAADIETLIIEKSILGPVRIAGGGSVGSLELRSSIVQAGPNELALAVPHSHLEARGCTVFGRIDARRISASELLATDTITVADVQSGCVRFSAFPAGSAVPHPYRSHTLVDTQSLFTSRRFGDPGYAQLGAACPEELRRGGADGSEIGAFHSLQHPGKLASLRAKVNEFLPFGLIALFVTET